MCRRHRSSYGYGHHGYGYGSTHHRGGPISALIGLAVPLLTQQQPQQQRNTFTTTREKPTSGVTQEPYQPYQQPPTPPRNYLAPQTTGRTVAPTVAPPLPANPATTGEQEPRGPPPAYYEHETRSAAAAAAADDRELEKNLSGMYISGSSPPAPALPSYTRAPNTTAADNNNNNHNNNNSSSRSSIGARDYQPTHNTTTAVAPMSAPRGVMASMLDPGSRWAARGQRREERAHAKLVRKEERYAARRERRGVC